MGIVLTGVIVVSSGGNPMKIQIDGVLPAWPAVRRVADRRPGVAERIRPPASG